MSKTLALIGVCVMLTGCGTMSGMNAIERINLVRSIDGLTKAGITEELIVATKDALDPARGGGLK